MTDSTRAHARLVAAFNQNDWHRVQQRSAQLLAIAPDDANVHFMSGVACIELGLLPGALEHLLKATQLEPRRADYAAQYAKALALQRRLREARMVANRAMTMAPDDPWTLDTLGVVYSQANALPQSAAAFRRLVTLAPGHVPAHFNLAHVLTALGDDEGAERALEACIRLEPRNWRTHLNLARLRRQTTTGNHIERLRTLLEQHGDDPHAQLLLNMALGKECEDIGDYPTAFEHYAHGKAAGRRLRPYNFARDAVMFDALIRAFPAIETGAPAGDPTQEPIFIIGMPRTGATLIDRILSNHPEVRSAGDLQNFPTLLQRASGCRGTLLTETDIAACTRHIDWQQLGAAYLASTRPASGKTTRFIDKLPHNFLYAGFIARALPNAKIVCLRRNPLDTCIGNFRHLFEQESGWYDYSLDINDIGRYYVQFDRLMTHWRTVLPGRILELHYESLVKAPVAAACELLGFCELPWIDACLRPEQNTEPVNIHGAWQACAPIHRDAMGRWERFEPELRELRWQLVDAGIDTAR